MKKIHVFLCVFAFFWNAKTNLFLSQFSPSVYNYSVESTSSNYEHLTFGPSGSTFQGTLRQGGDVLRTVDFSSTNFRFSFCGVEYDKLKVSSNGFITFSQTLTTSLYFNSFSPFPSSPGKATRFLS